MKTKIYIAAHEAFNPPNMEGYCPIQVGSALHNPLGYLRDDAGNDHISEKNPFYSELTALYWMWQNDADSDILGLVHYRRYFLDETKKILTAAHAESILKNADIILPEVLTLDQGSIESQFIELHHPDDLVATKNAIHKICPEYESDFDRVLSGNKTYCCNMMIAPEKTVKDYAAWLFPILFEVEKHLDITQYDTYNKRIYGFISERLLTVYVLHNRLKIQELMIGATEEKVETREYVEEIDAIIKDGRYEDAYNRMVAIIDARPDTFLPNSDIHSRLSHRWYLLNIRHMEMQIDMYSGIWDQGLSVDEMIGKMIKLQGYMRLLCSKKDADAAAFISANKISLMMIKALFEMMHFSAEQQLHFLANTAECLMEVKDPNLAILYANFAKKLI